MEQFFSEILSVFKLNKQYNTLILYLNDDCLKVDVLAKNLEDMNFQYLQSHIKIYFPQASLLAYSI